MKFIQFSKALKEKIEPVYLIDGDDAYFRDSAVETVRAALNLTQPLLNDFRYEGEALKGDRLAAFRDELYTLPFFDEKRLVRVYGFYPSEKEFSGVLQPYLEKPCESTVLLIVNEGKRANAADLKKKKLIVVDCNRETEETLSRWLFALMRRAGLSADADVCDLMVRYCASDAARLKSETEKLKSLLGEGGRVTRQTVDAEIAKDTEYRIYELTQAASARNFSSFTEILNELTRKGMDEYAVLSSLTAHFKTLTEVSRFRGSDEAAQRTLNLKAYPLKKNREICARLGKERVKEYYLCLYALGAGARSGKYSKTGALSQAIAKIFFS